jgi:hypothetical protein
MYRSSHEVDPGIEAMFVIQSQNGKKVFDSNCERDTNWDLKKLSEEPSIILKWKTKATKLFNISTQNLRESNKQHADL